MKFGEYVGDTVNRVAHGKPVDREQFKARMELFFALLAHGMSPRAARNVMDLYM